MQFKSIDVHSWLKNNMFWTYYSVIKAIIPSIKYVEHNIPLADCWTEPHRHQLIPLQKEYKLVAKIAAA